MLDPSQVGHRVPITLTRRFTEKLNGAGQITQRTEIQQISVLDGSAINPNFQEVSRLLAPKVEPRTQATVIERSQHDDEETFDLDAFKRMVEESK